MSTLCRSIQSEHGVDEGLPNQRIDPYPVQPRGRGCTGPVILIVRFEIMIRAITNVLNNLTFLRKSVANSYPDENVLFATSVTHLRTADAGPTGWSAKRFRQRRGIAVFTNKRLVVKSSFISPLTVVWLVLAVLMAWRWWDARAWLDLFIAVGALAFILQRRPFTYVIECEQIKSATLGSVRGIAGAFPLLTLQTEQESVNLVTADVFPAEVLRHVGINNEGTEPEVGQVSSEGSPSDEPST